MVFKIATLEKLRHLLADLAVTLSQAHQLKLWCTRPSLTCLPMFLATESHPTHPIPSADGCPACGPVQRLPRHPHWLPESTGQQAGEGQRHTATGSTYAAVMLRFCMV